MFVADRWPVSISSRQCHNQTVWKRIFAKIVGEVTSGSEILIFKMYQKYLTSYKKISFNDLSLFPQVRSFYKYVDSCLKTLGIHLPKNIRFFDKSQRGGQTSNDSLSLLLRQRRRCSMRPTGDSDLQVFGSKSRIRTAKCQTNESRLYRPPEGPLSNGLRATLEWS